MTWEFFLGWITGAVMAVVIAWFVEGDEAVRYHADRAAQGLPPKARTRAERDARRH